MMLNLNSGLPRADLTKADLAENISEIDRLWDAIVNVMDDETREKVAAELAPCSKIEFLARYLELAPCDLVVG